MEKAKKTFMAFVNPYKSVIKVFPNVINYPDSLYLGVKNTKEIKDDFLKQLEQNGIYQHTSDVMSHNGRAIDIQLKHPITGRPMTGSSSGTAINVFLGINDIGLGTDGGGSVLAPAISLNLFSIISPMFTTQFEDKLTTKYSTDGIQFKVSYGMMMKNSHLLKNIIQKFLPLESSENYSIVTDDISLKDTIKSQVEFIDLSNKYQLSRLELIQKLENLLENYDCVISKEGPIDLMGFGDTVFGHFDNYTKSIQEASHKGFLKVVNMMGLSAITIPSRELSTGYVVIAKSTPKHNTFLLKILDYFESEYNDSLTTQYFTNVDSYFTDGFIVK